MQKTRKRNRLKEYNYSTPAYYFITTCVNNFKHSFGDVKDERMILNNYGKIVEKCWVEVCSKHANIEPDEYVVMPNHFHSIIIISSMNVVGTTHELSLQPKQKTLSTYIGEFKMQSSKQIHIAGLTSFKWQRSFYDRIIRNEKELFKIRKYIKQNPLAWDIEKNPQENIKLDLISS